MAHCVVRGIQTKLKGKTKGRLPGKRKTNDTDKNKRLREGKERKKENAVVTTVYCVCWEAVRVFGRYAHIPSLLLMHNEM